MYSKKNLETLKKLKVSKFPLVSISESFDTFFLCDEQGSIFQINKEKFKIQNQINLQKEITKIAFDQELVNLLVSDTSGLLLFFNKNLEKVR